MNRKRRAVSALIATALAAAAIAEARAETPYYAFPPFWPLIAIGALVGVPPPGYSAASPCCYYRPPPCYCAPLGLPYYPPPRYGPPPGYAAPPVCRPGYCPPG